MRSSIDGSELCRNKERTESFTLLNVQFHYQTPEVKHLFSCYRRYTNLCADEVDGVGVDNSEDRESPRLSDDVDLSREFECHDQVEKEVGYNSHGDSLAPDFVKKCEYQQNK